MILSLVFCQAVLIGRGYSAGEVHHLKPLPQDEMVLAAKKDHYSFVVDLFDYSTTNTIRMFVHDVKADYTAVSSGSFGANNEITLKQVIGFETSDPLTISVSCFKN